jgi:hypothetical protein
MNGGTVRLVVTFVVLVVGGWVWVQTSGSQPQSTDIVPLALLVAAASSWALVHHCRGRGSRFARAKHSPITARLNELGGSFHELARTEPRRALMALEEHDALAARLPAGEAERSLAIGRCHRAELYLTLGRVEEVEAALGPREGFVGSSAEWWPVEVRSRELRAVAEWWLGRWADAESDSLAAAEIDRRVVDSDPEHEPRWPHNVLTAALAAAQTGAHDRAAAHLTQAASAVDSVEGDALETKVLVTRVQLAHRARRSSEVAALLAELRDQGAFDEPDPQISRKLYSAQWSIELPGAIPVPPPVPRPDATPERVSSEWLAARVEQVWRLNDQLRLAEQLAVFDDLEPHLDAFDNSDRQLLLFHMSAVRTMLGDGVSARRSIDALAMLADEFSGSFRELVQVTVHQLRASVLVMEQNRHAAAVELDRAVEGTPPGGWGEHQARLTAVGRSNLAVQSERWEEVEVLVSDLPDPGPLDYDSVRYWAMVMLDGAVAAAASGQRELAQTRLSDASEVLEQCGGPANLGVLLAGRLRTLRHLGRPGRAWALVAPLVAALDATGNVAARADIAPDIEELASQLGLAWGGDD